jgi:hypothetical protein
MADPTNIDPYVVTQEFNGTHVFSNPYNVTYGEAVTQLGGLQVLGMNLIVDSGFAGNERVDLTSATVGVGGTGTYTETSRRSRHPRSLPSARRMWRRSRSPKLMALLPVT